MPPTIAIDGPAASGKGTLSKRLAAHYGYAHLDTGSLYRAVGLMVLLAGGDPAQPELALAAAKALTPESAILTHPGLRADEAAQALTPESAILSHPGLRADDAAQAASLVAAMPEVRAALLDFQHAFAASPPG